MFRNYFKIAFRNLLRYKTYAIINIAGFAIGVTCCALLLLFVYDETSYDTFHKNGKRIFRVIKIDSDLTGTLDKIAITPPPLAPALIENFSEIELAVRLKMFGGNFKFNDTEHFEGFLFSDPGFFEMFSFRLIRGNSKTVLTDPKSLVITQNKAVQYFADSDPIGKTIIMKHGQKSFEFTVTGIIDEIPKNSSLRFDMLMPIAIIKEILGENNLNSWKINDVITYVQLKQPEDAEILQAKLQQFVEKHFQNPPNALELQSILDIYLEPEVKGGIEAVSNPLYSWILSGIAILILILACVNFMNLSTGQLTARTKEVGIRKTVGAKRLQLITQFLVESMLMSCLVLVVSFCLSLQFLPVFNELSGKTFTIKDMYNWTYLLSIIGLVLVTGLLTGMYPALLLSSFHPVQILRPKFKFTGTNLFSKILIVFQFSASVFLITFTLIMIRQLSFLRDKDLGYNGEQIVVVPIGQEAYSIYKNEILQYRGIVDVSSGMGPFGSGLMTVKMDFQGRDFWSRAYSCDYNFIDVLGIEIIEGRGFQTDRTSDKKAVIVNEAFIKETGLINPIGKSLPSFLGLNNPTIIGVVRNFHFRSLQYNIEPLCLYWQPSWATFIKIRPEETSKTIAYLKQKWQELRPNEIFDYYFLDEYVNRLYDKEERWSKIAGLASALAMIVASIGLYGITLLAVVERTKEIGIRKVFGATVWKISTLLTRDAIELVLVASLIAGPMAFYAIQKWLQNFAYHCEITIWPFVLACSIVTFFALTAISFQTLKASNVNPANSLRYE